MAIGEEEAMLEYFHKHSRTRTEIKRVKDEKFEDKSECEKKYSNTKKVTMA